MDVVRAYSKRLDLVDDLERAVRRLRDAKAEVGGERRSVRSAGPRRAPAPVRERLGEAGLAELVAQRRTGATVPELVERFGISRSSVKRMLRRLHV